VCRQCELLDLPRSSYYYEPGQETPENLRLMRLIDKEYTDHPEKGSRRMAVRLKELGHGVNRKRVQRLMRLMGLEAIYPKPKLSVPEPQGLSVSASERDDRPGGPGVEHGYHLYSLGFGIHVPGGGHRLV
jgi:HTH-like domain